MRAACWVNTNLLTIESWRLYFSFVTKVPIFVEDKDNPANQKTISGNRKCERRNVKKTLRRSAPYGNKGNPALQVSTFTCTAWTSLAQTQNLVLVSFYMQRRKSRHEDALVLDTKWWHASFQQINTAPFPVDTLHRKITFWSQATDRQQLFSFHTYVLY